MASGSFTDGYWSLDGWTESCCGCSNGIGRPLKPKTTPARTDHDIAHRKKGRLTTTVPVLLYIKNRSSVSLILLFSFVPSFIYDSLSVHYRSINLICIRYCGTEDHRWVARCCCHALKHGEVRHEKTHNCCATERNLTTPIFLCRAVECWRFTRQHHHHHHAKTSDNTGTGFQVIVRHRSNSKVSHGKRIFQVEVLLQERKPS